MNLQLIIHTALIKFIKLFHLSCLDTSNLVRHTHTFWIKDLGQLTIFFNNLQYKVTTYNDQKEIIIMNKSDSLISNPQYCPGLTEPLLVNWSI